MNFFSRKNTILFFTCSFLLFSCNRNPLKVDVKSIEVKPEILRFDIDLFESKLNTLEAFKAKYGSFLPDYIYGIMGFEGDEKTAFNQLMMFKNDPNAKKVYEHTKEQFKDFTPYENEIKKAYQYFKYYYPEEVVPKIITYTSNFSFYINPVGQDYIGIGLDMHLGENFTPYKYAEIENYWHKILTPQTIVLHQILAHANDKFTRNISDNPTFLDKAIYEGKLLYFTDATLLDMKDNVKIGMSEKEYAWCLAEEQNIWNYFVTKKLIYESDSRKYTRFFKEGPKTIAEDMAEDAPPMLGKFIGWQIVRKYMTNKNPKLQDFMQNTNAAEILNDSKYKP